MTDKDAAISIGAPSPELHAVDHTVAVVSSGRSRSGRALLRNPLFWVGSILALTVLAAAVFAPVLAPHDPTHEYRELMPLDGSALPPSEMFPLGTDRAGRDYLSRLLYAARMTVLVGLVANTLATVIGLVVGLTAGYVRTHERRVGRSTVRIPVDGLLMRITDVGLAFPALLLAIAVTAALEHRSIELLIGVIALILWTTTARIVYGRTRILSEAEFVTAARALGSSSRRIVGRHLLPHILPLVVVYASLGIAVTLLFEATLSYLGAGAPPASPTWGSLLADHVGYYRTDPRLVLLPGLAIAVTVLAFNFLGDALRDALDPRAWR
jgi:peptide/nickel transport system permease protein